MKLSEPGNSVTLRSRHSRPSAGFTLLEMVLVVLVSMVVAAIAIPALNRAMTNERVNSAVSQLSGAIQSTRFRAIKDSQAYTFALATPANTYVVTNTVTLAADRAVPLPSYVSINGGIGATFTYTLCPNGIVYGAGGTCVPPPVTAPPALSFTYQNRQINIAVSDVGNVTTTTIQ